LSEGNTDKDLNKSEELSAQDIEKETGVDSHTSLPSASCILIIN